MEGRKDLDLELSLKQEMEDRISDLQKECILDDLQELPPVKENDVNISTTYIFENDEGYEASIFFEKWIKYTNKF